MTFSRLDKLIDNLGDRVNPVLVKEVRQSFHNTWITVFAAAVLLAELAIMFVFSSDVFSRTSRGSFFFAWLLCILTGGGVVIAGAIPMQRFYSERKSTDLDYSSITNLSAVRQVAGRLVSAMLSVGLLYAMCLPFMVISYFLGGVSLTGMLALALFFFMILVLVAQAGLLFGSSGNRFVSVLFLLALLGSAWVLVLLPFMLSGADELAEVLNLRNFWIAVSATLLAWGLLFVATVASVLPQAANRMLPVRLYILALILLTPLLPFFWGLDIAGDWQAWFYGCALFATSMLFVLSAVAACERDKQSLRVLRHSPRWLICRVPFFVMSSGSGGGLVLSWLVFGVIGLLLWLPPAAHVDEKFVTMVILCGARALLVAGAAMLCRRHWKFFRRLPAPVTYCVLTGLLFMLEMVGMAVSDEWICAQMVMSLYLVLAVAALLLNGPAVYAQYYEYALVAYQADNDHGSDNDNDFDPRKL